MKKYLREGRAERKYENKEEKTKGDKNTEIAFVYQLMPAPLTCIKKSLYRRKSRDGPVGMATVLGA